MSSNSILLMVAVPVILMAILSVGIGLWLYTRSRRRANRTLALTRRLYQPILLELNELGIEFGKESEASFFSLSTIEKGAFSEDSEQMDFDKVKEALSKQGLDIYVGGVKKPLPFGAILDQVKNLDDIENEVRTATRKYIEKFSAD